MRAVHGMLESGVGSVILIAATVVSLTLANYGIAIYSTTESLCVCVCVSVCLYIDLFKVIWFVSRHIHTYIGF